MSHDNPMRSDWGKRMGDAEDRDFATEVPKGFPEDTARRSVPTQSAFAPTILDGFPNRGQIHVPWCPKKLEGHPGPCPVQPESKSSEKHTLKPVHAPDIVQVWCITCGKFHEAGEDREGDYEMTMQFVVRGHGRYSAREAQRLNMERWLRVHLGKPEGDPSVVVEVTDTTLTVQNL